MLKLCFLGALVKEWFAGELHSLFVADFMALEWCFAPTSVALRCLWNFLVVTSLDCVIDEP